MPVFPPTLFLQTPYFYGATIFRLGILPWGAKFIWQCRFATVRPFATRILIFLRLIAHPASSGLILGLPALNPSFCQHFLRSTHPYCHRHQRDRETAPQPVLGAVIAVRYLSEVAGMVGFEPTVHCTKNSCLTTWLHPNVSR